MTYGNKVDQAPAVDGTSATTARWPGGWVRALLPTAILACLDQKPLHGYAIAQALGELGFGIPRGGALYPVLARLEDAGEVEARWTPGTSGPARRQYTLTTRGTDRLEADRLRLKALGTAIGTSSGRTTNSDEGKST